MSVSVRQGPGLQFKVEGLDCQNEVATLKKELGPVVGGPHNLAFDTAQGLMTVSAGVALAPDEIAAVVARTGMRATLQNGPGTPRRFEVRGLDCQNEVRQLEKEVGPVVGGAERLTFDVKNGIMTVASEVQAADSAITEAVARTGMWAALLSANVRSAADALRLFQVRGLDCQNEVRHLQQEVGPVVGGADRLTFDTKNGLMGVTESRAADSAIIAAVGRTGMSATPLKAEEKRPEPVDACGASCGTEALTTPVPTHEAGRPVFRIHGMDCGEEVTALKREVGPLVGGEDKLSFDLINGRMSVSADAAVVPLDAISQAVARTGMTAEPWQEGATAAGAADLRRRKVQSALTISSGILAALGFALHALSAGSIAAAFGVESAGAAAGTPWPAVAAYALSIIGAVRYVAPKAWLAARNLRPDMNLLMVVAVAGAVGIGEWFEAATVSFFFALALALEAWSLDRARRAVAALMELAPSTARVKMPDGLEVDRPAADVAVGSHIVVRPGDKIPLDGRVVAGNSAVNQAPITGESVPVSMSPGSEVFAGTINGEGALEIETTKAAQDTTLAQIIRMVGSAQSLRAPTEQWVDRFARIYTPTVLVLALLVLFVPPLALGGAWDIWFYRALVLLVIACPCALVISTPVSIVAGLAGAARAGVLVKGGVYLEAPAHLKAVAMDKTGTLTEGRPKVVAIKPLDGHTAEELLTFATALEARSAHPLARAIVERAEESGIRARLAEDVQAVPGKGVTGRVGDRSVWLGSRRYVEERGQLNSSLVRAGEELAADGRTLVMVGDERRVIGLIALSDTVRPSARAIVSALHASGIERVVMLTGDNRATAEAIARETGVDEVMAELLPADKVEAVEALVKQHGAVAMVGDGVNDAPAMARASLGIAMGAIGSDAAIETADVALMSDDLAKVPWLVRHSRATLAIIRQNIGFSIAVKLVFTVLTFAGAASLWGAIVADVGASLLVVLNGLRLRNREVA